MAEERVKQVRFIFEKSPDYKIINASGAWGGVSPNGLIFFNLFVETVPAPDTQLFALNPDGSLGGQLDKKAPEDMVINRLLEIGVIMTPEIAISVAKWLLEKAAEVTKKEAGQP